jgi:hypothetical protein
LQVAEISDLQKDLKDAEGQRDMLLELMQSSDHMSVEEVQSLCNRLEESVAASSSELSDRLQGEQAARKKVWHLNALSTVRMHASIIHWCDDTAMCRICWYRAESVLTLVRFVQLEARYHQDVGELKQQVISLQPSTPQPSILNSQSYEMTLNPQPSILSPQPSTLSPQS